MSKTQARQQARAEAAEAMAETEDAEYHIGWAEWAEQVSK